MEQWKDLFDYSIVAKSADKTDHRTSNLVNHNDLSENVLSPVTNLMLNALVKIFDSDDDLIINFPKKILKPIPLIAYLFSEMKAKSVLVFTAGNINNKKDLIRVHNDNFYLLNMVNEWGSSANLYENCSMGYLKSKSELSYKFFLPHANLEYKKYLNQNLNSILGDENKPKIVLMGESSLTSLTNTINRISVDNDELNDGDIDNHIDLDIGCIIFENADKYFSSRHNAEFFVKWLNENINSDINVIFHFSNHDLNYLSHVKELTKAKVISFNGGIIKNNDILIESSLSYFKNVNNLDIVGNYNLDDQNDYDYDSKMILDDFKLEKGNLDYFSYSARKITEFINDDEIGINSLYFNAQKLFLDLNNLTINPSFLKFQIRYQNTFSYVTVPQFIDLFENSLKNESAHNRIYLRKYLSLLSQFYHDLVKRKRFNEPNSYNGIGKDYRLREIIENKEKYFENKNDIVIGTFYNTEPGILSNQLKDYSNVEVKYMGNLIKEYFDSSNLNLLLPGFVPPKFLSELYKDYSKILFLNYDGFNRKNIIHQINSIEKPSINDESKVMNYFLELYDYIGISKDNAFVNNYKKRLEKEIISNDDIKNSVPKDLGSTDEYVKNIDEETENYDDYLEIIKNIEKRISNNQSTPNISIDYSPHIQHSNLKTIELELIVQRTNNHIKKTIPAKNKYLHFKDYGSLEEAFEIRAEDLSKGDYVIILDNEKISFIDLFIEIFKLEENIDKNLAQYWKDKISIFVEDNNLTYDEFHEMYKKEGGTMGIQTIRNWIKGKNISPRDYKTEFVYLSKVMDDDFLLDNIDIMGEEFRKIKSMHIAMGRNLKAIMKGIIVDDFSLNYDLLSLEEQTMHTIIKNSVYQVIKVKSN
ncbi:hypothetical protein [uncultured Methanobrevibacter sp.]|uniref:DISARM anti-phage system protein DrmE domain-containing protein n=1 Tax=uncultured Methanobrevibacter sp. TaxID=253161 RepID=UPI0025E3DD1C|nr:hypothetical protein [uncultured Methanobrevibacter sp.]